jgi:hypothetical protein
MLENYIRAKHYLTNLMLLKEIAINNLNLELDYIYRNLNEKPCKELLIRLKAYKKELREIKNNLKISNYNIIVVVNSDDVVTAVYDSHESFKMIMTKGTEHRYSQLIQQIPKVGEVFIPDFVLQPWLKRNMKLDKY